MEFHVLGLLTLDGMRVGRTWMTIEKQNETCKLQVVDEIIVISFVGFASCCH